MRTLARSDCIGHSGRCLLRGGQHALADLPRPEAEVGRVEGSKGFVQSSRCVFHYRLSRVSFAISPGVFSYFLVPALQRRPLVGSVRAKGLRPSLSACLPPSLPRPFPSPPFFSSFCMFAVGGECSARTWLQERSRKCELLLLVRT